MVTNKEKVDSIYRNNGRVRAGSLISQLTADNAQEAILFGKLKGLCQVWDEYLFREPIVNEIEKLIENYLGINSRTKKRR